MIGASLNIASWYRNGLAAINRASAMKIDWLVMQEVRVDPRQAKGARGMIGSDLDLWLCFAALPGVPGPPRRGEQREDRR
eukprot:10523756-Alexandrium_andersonii.AAC.1